MFQQKRLDKNTVISLLDIGGWVLGIMIKTNGK